LSQTKFLYYVFQQLYSIHLADHTEDCTVQLADHIKVLDASSPLYFFMFYSQYFPAEEK